MPSNLDPSHSRRIARFGLVAAVLLVGTCLTVLVSFSPPDFPMIASATYMPTQAPTDAMPSATQLLTGTLQDVNGGAFDLASLRGRTSVLYFASIESLDAVTTAEQLNELAALHPAETGVQIVSLNQDTGAGKRHDPLAVRVHAKMLEVAFPTLLDTDARVAGNFQVNQAGQFLVINAVGDVIYRGPFEAGTGAGEPQRSVQQAVREAISTHSDPEATLVAFQRRTS